MKRFLIPLVFGLLAAYCSWLIAYTSSNLEDIEEQTCSKDNKTYLKNLRIGSIVMLVISLMIIAMNICGPAYTNLLSKRNVIIAMSIIFSVLIVWISVELNRSTRLEDCNGTPLFIVSILVAIVLLGFSLLLVYRETTSDNPKYESLASAAGRASESMKDRAERAGNALSRANQRFWEGKKSQFNYNY